MKLIQNVLLVDGSFANAAHAVAVIRGSKHLTSIETPKVCNARLSSLMDGGKTIANCYKTLIR
jgi:hypothetical protein